MTIQCPECGARYRIDPSRVTKAVARVKCPQCANLFEISLDAAGEKPSLPSAGKPEAAPRAAAQPSGGQKAVGGGVPATTATDEVLVVDDSKFFRELIADVLKPLHLRFHMAADGAEALRIIRQEHPALVILDLNLPGMSGHELIREVRSDPSIRSIRLLAMSGVYRSETDAVAVQAAGADDFVSKSFKPEQLRLRVKKLLPGGS